MHAKYSNQRGTTNMLLRTSISAFTLSLALTGLASADHSPWYVSANMGVVAPDSARDSNLGDVSNGTLAAFSVGREIGESWAAELRAATFSLSADDSDRETDQSSIGLDLHWYPFGRLVDDALVRPYLLAGVGFLSTDVGDDFSSDNAGASLGFGASLRVFNTGLSLRGEGRYALDFVDSDDEDSFGDWQGTIGVQIPVGRQTETGASPKVAKPSLPQPEPEPEVEPEPVAKPQPKPTVAEKEQPAAPAQKTEEANQQPVEVFSPFGNATEAPAPAKAQPVDATPPKQAAAIPPKPVAKPKPAPKPKPVAESKPVTKPKPSSDNIFSSNIADSDGDGIRNAVDLCPGTTSSGYVDADGCPLNFSGAPPVKKAPPVEKTPPAKPAVVAAKPKVEPKPVEPKPAAAPKPKANTAPSSSVKSVTTMQLKGVSFASGSSELTASSLPAVKRVASLMKKKTSLQVEIGGHTDSQGSTSANLALSQERASAVKDALVAEGVNFRRITAKGYGDSKPIADNSTADGRQQNRRIELKLIRRK